MRDRFRVDVLRRWSLVPALLACLLPVSSLCHGQSPQPTVSYVFPRGGQRGKTVEAVLVGPNLKGATAVRISGTGVTASVIPEAKPEPVAKPDPNAKPDPKAQAAAEAAKVRRPRPIPNQDLVRVSIAIAPDAELGERDLRLVTPAGISARSRFIIDELPELNVIEPNAEKAKAIVVQSLPAVANGQLIGFSYAEGRSPDRGYFRFTAKAGQTLVCQCQARALLPVIADAVPGWLDACLTLYDADGKQLKYVDDFRFKPDPVLFHKVEKDGEYLLEVRDVLHRSKHEFTYRLRVGALPYLTHIFPLGGQRNSAAKIELHGVNLPTDNMDFTIPGDSPAVRYLSVAQGGVTSNSLPFAVGDLPEIRETEPNDSPQKANRVTAPVTVNGRIQQGGDADCFVFKAEAGQKLVMEVQARRLDSPLDSVLTLLDASGKELAENDDPPQLEQAPDRSGSIDPVEALVTHYADSRLVYTFPAAGDYVLRIRDAQDKGGEEYAYRLTIAPPRPDYILRIGTDSARVAQGDSAVIAVNALRKDDFDGEIHLTVQDLPPGLVASDAVILAKQNETRLTITTPLGAAATLFSPTIVGTATVDNQTLVRKAVPVEAAMQAFYLKHLLPTQGCLLAVEEGAFFTLSTNTPPTQVLEVRQGGEVQVVVKALRKEGANFPINLAAVTPPQGISVKVAEIPADKGEATITIGVSQQPPVGLRQNIILAGTMKTAKETVTRVAPAISLKITAAK